MQKAPPFPKSGASHYKKIDNTIIVVRSSTEKQEFGTIELLKYISHLQLTDCLQLLENAGLTGDVAIFVLKSIQSISLNKGGAE